MLSGGPHFLSLCYQVDLGLVQISLKKTIGWCGFGLELSLSDVNVCFQLERRVSIIFGSFFIR